MAHGHGAWLKQHLIVRHTNPPSHCREISSLETRIDILLHSVEKPQSYYCITFEPYSSWE